MKKITSVLLILCGCQLAQSQNCTVALDSLKGQYSGDCKKGKAEGIGTATGIDMYTGQFKNGLPNGKGKYTWHNGNWYDGSWKDGLFDGQGTLYSTKPDSIKQTTGFWKKGKFIGKYEHPYKIDLLTNNFSGNTIRKLNSALAELTINVKTITGGGTTYQTSKLPKAVLTGIQLIEGRYEQQMSDDVSSTIANTYTFRDVTFPFYAILSFETVGSNLQPERVAIEILETGNWYVHLTIEN